MSAIFRCISHLSGAVWLDSAGQARFDVLSANPVRTLPLAQSGDLPAVISWVAGQSRPQGLRPCPTLQHLPFTIGCIGSISYELAAGSLTSVRPKPGPRLPGAWFGFYDWSLVLDHQDQRGWLIVDSRSASDRQDALRRLLLIGSSITPFPGFRTRGEMQPHPAGWHRQGYEAAFRQIKHYLHGGDCYQVNLAQAFRSQCEGDAFVLYDHLRLLQPGSMSVFLRLNESTALLSCSPERLLSVGSELRATSEPIKGTRPRSTDEHADGLAAKSLGESPKDRAEHLMILDLVRNDLGQVCETGSIRVEEAFAIRNLRNVHQMVSRVSGQLASEERIAAALRALLPAGSITGAPKRSALQIIDRVEPVMRSSYCGTLGYWDVRQRADFNVNIRSLVCSEGELWCWGGGGIVADSDLDAERSEIHFKVQRLLAGCGHFMER